MPERTASHTNADVYTVSAMTANTKNENRISSRGRPKVAEDEHQRERRVAHDR